MSRRKLRRWRSAKPKKKRSPPSEMFTQMMASITSLHRDLQLEKVGLVRYQTAHVTALGGEVLHMVPVIRLWMSR